MEKGSENVEMKKCLLLFVAAVFLLAASPLRASLCAEGVSAFDLSSFGLVSFRAGTVSCAPAADGEIRTGEYSASTAVRFGEGLFLAVPESGKDLTSSARDTIDFDPAGIEALCCIAFDSDTAYFAVRFTAPSPSFFPAAYTAGPGRALTVSFSAGLSQSPSLSDQSSVWSGTYYIRDNACVGASGEICRYENGAGILERRFRSWDNDGRDSYRDGSGFLWDGAGYAVRAGGALVRGEVMSELTVECAVPLAELMLTVPASERSEVQRDLKSGGTVHGAFYAGVVLSQNAASGERTMLITARGAGELELQSPASELLLSPLYWRGTPPAPAKSGSAERETSADPSSDGSDDAGYGGTATGLTDIGFDPVLTETWETQTIPETWDPALVRYPGSGNEMIEAEDPEPSALSPWIAVAAGVLLSAAALFLLLTVRAMDRRDRRRGEEEAKKIAARKEARKTGEGSPVVRRRKRR